MLNTKKKPSDFDEIQKKGRIVIIPGDRDTVQNIP